MYAQAYVLFYKLYVNWFGNKHKWTVDLVMYMWGMYMKAWNFRIAKFSSLLVCYSLAVWESSNVEVWQCRNAKVEQCELLFKLVE